MFQIPLNKLIQVCLLIFASTTLILACTQTQTGSAGIHASNQLNYHPLPAAQNSFSMHRTWPNVPPSFSHGIQAGLNWENGQLTWYNGKEELNMHKQSSAATLPQPIFAEACNSDTSLVPEGPCQLPEIDAALFYNTNLAYFFSGDTYAAFDVQRKEFLPEDGGKIASTSERNPWKNLPIEFQYNLDATVNDGIGNIYFFKGTHYLRYDRFLSHVIEAPALISERWPMLPREFHSGIDAAVRRGRGTVVLFKGSQSIEVTTQEQNI